jgi:hypothetical protein
MQRYLPERFREALVILEDEAITRIEREGCLHWLFMDSQLFFVRMRVHHTEIWWPGIYRKREEDGVKEKI